VGLPAHEAIFRCLLVASRFVKQHPLRKKRTFAVRSTEIARLRKYCFRFAEFSANHKAIPRRARGRIAIVTNVAQDAMDANSRVQSFARTSGVFADGKGVWAWHPWLVAGAELAGLMIAQATVTQKPVSPGRARRSLSRPSRREYL